MGGTETPHKAREDHEHTVVKWQAVVAVLGVIGALLALVPVVLGVFDSDEEGTSSDPTATASVASTTSTVTTTATTSSPTTASSTAAPEIFNETTAPISVREGYGVDVDSQEANWGVNNSGVRDFSVSSGAYSIGGGDFGDVKFVIVDHEPTLDECEAQTALQTVVEVEQTVVGQRLCVRSSEGRWAYVRIASIDHGTGEMSFDIRVWKLPTDP